MSMITFAVSGFHFNTITSKAMLTTTNISSNKNSPIQVQKTCQVFPD